jgi:hypothetical protein
MVVILLVVEVVITVLNLKLANQVDLVVEEVTLLQVAVEELMQPAVAVVELLVQLQVPHLVMVVLASWLFVIKSIQ